MCFNVLNTGIRREIRTEGVCRKLCYKNIRKIFHAVFVFRITDIENLTIATVVPIFDDSEKALYPVLDICETPFLLAAIHESDGGAFYKVKNKLGNDPGTADPR
jgi:hypothetical protein